MCLCGNLFWAAARFSLLCPDIFRDYEADYSATLSTEEAELQAQEGGRRWREADEKEADEEEEGRGTLFLVLGMASPVIYPHSAAPLCARRSVLTFSVLSLIYFLFSSILKLHRHAIKACKAPRLS